MKRDAYNPPLSIVAASRNDSHGGNLLERMQLFLDSLLYQCKRYNLNIELILVEWNPPYKRKRLKNALIWPSDPGPCRVRIIQVPPQVHKQFRHSENLSLFQMLAKNVGIRRAFGKYILATNIDILFSDELIRYLASGRLSKKCYYRVDRYDVELKITPNIAPESLLDLCKQNVIRICAWEGIHDLREGRFYSIHHPMDWRRRIRERMQDLGMAPVNHPTPLHTNACGDFTLMSRENWFALRGYPELEIFSFHLDSLGIHAAYHSGLKEKILKDPMRIYHFEHASGSGWTPEGQTKLNHRIDRAGISRITSEEFYQWGIKMRSEGRPVIFAGEDWGLATEKLPEQSIYGKPNPEVEEKSKKSVSVHNLHTLELPGEPKKIPATGSFLIIDPKSRISEKPLVSVVVPCLNRADFLVPTIESILQQDYSKIECIVVDGGSTDGTIGILKGYRNKIKWISEPDRNHADAIAKGWDMSNGEILAWLNADDLWQVPDAVSRAVEYLQANPEVSLVFGACGKVDARGNLIGRAYSHHWDLSYAVEFCDHCIPQPSTFIRRDILDKVGGIDTDFASKKDHELWLRIGLHGEIRHIGAYLGHARDIAGLSQDGKMVARSCVQVTRKFFSLPDIPGKIKRRKRRALSNSYLKGMDYAFESGRLWRIIVGYALCAAVVDPTNSINAFRRLRRIFCIGAQEGVADNRMLFRLVWNMVDLALGNGNIISVTRHTIKNFRMSFTKALPPRFPNLLGDRELEWSWIASHIPDGPGKVLDFGSGAGYLALYATQKGFEVTAVDLGIKGLPFLHPHLNFLHGDILKLPLPEEGYDLVINCSTVEHVGLSGRYGVAITNQDGDLEAMIKLRKLMKPEALMLLTVPVGVDRLCAPLCRVYGRKRLPLLLSGYSIEKEAYYAKDKYNLWVLCHDKEWVLDQKPRVNSLNPLRNLYAIGCFVLKKEILGQR